ncbi:MAG: hypothetical protein QOI47_1824 [Actinomycetota bacterium]|jgi:quercetin dioxygenase-like cupin family protein|nr:hypothetical protein [Actinomycetota bacterium]
MTDQQTETQTTRGITFYEAGEAPSLDASGMMTPPQLDPSIYTELDLKPLAAGSKTTVLFRGEGPSAFSLVYAWFGPGYRLPRHSHSADCLYYVVSGEAILGRRAVGAGSGFFVKAGQPYTYVAGADGVEVLEFRQSTSFDMQVLDQTVERWMPIVAAAVANQATWIEQHPA